MKYLFALPILLTLILSLAYSGIASIQEVVNVTTDKNSTACFLVFSKNTANVTVYIPKEFEKNFDIVYITNNSFPLKSYLDKCSSGNIDCIADLCRKNLQDYCKIVCLIFYKKSWSNNYEVKEINGTIGTIINAGSISVAEVLPFKVYLINEPRKSEIPIYFWIIVIIAGVIGVFILSKYIRLSI